MSLALLAAAAHAGTVQGGVQAALFPDGIAFAEDMLAGLTISLQWDDLSGEYGCYDAIGASDVAFEVPIRTLAITPRDGELVVEATFDPIFAEDATIYGIDAEYTDACVEFETDVRYLELNDAELVLVLGVDVDDGVLALEVADDPVLTGELESDVDWFPDDLALYYFEEALLDLLANQVADRIPGLVAPYVAEPLLGESYGDWEVGLEWSDVDVSSESVRLAANASIAWVGDDGCPTEGDDGEPGRDPEIDFGDGEGSTFAVGVTEGAVNEVFLSAWRDGYFCFTEDNVAEFVARVQDLFDPDVGGLAGTASLGTAPRVTVDGDGLHVALEGARIVLTGTLDGRTETLLDVEADLTGLLDVGVDQSLSSFSLGIRELELDIVRLEADHLVSEDAEAEALLAQFLEEWAGAWVTSQTDDMVLFSSLYHLFDVYLRVDRLVYEEGAIAIFASLFAADDPEVDLEPPDTDFALASSTADGATLDLYAQDDRDGPIAWSWRVSGGAWSAWTSESRVSIAGLVPGTYTVEVVARDSWLNVDPTPAEGWLEIGTSTTRACACGATDGGVAFAIASAVLGALARRRRAP
ncbi:MAG: hypothetical protein ACOZNI_14590 [Myxococcota bacterium]